MKIHHYNTRMYIRTFCLGQKCPLSLFLFIGVLFGVTLIKRVRSRSLKAPTAMPYATTTTRYDITGLDAGTAMYVRVSAHTLMSYGYAALSSPEFQTPSNVQPGAPAAVRLVATSESSIQVAWGHPTVDGGADIAGYELWMGEWATANFRLVYDGVDDEDTTSFTVDTR